MAPPAVYPNFPNYPTNIACSNVANMGMPYPESQGCSMNFPQDTWSNPIHLNQSNNFNWDHQSRIGDDCCSINLDEREAQKPGLYMLSGYDPNCNYNNIQNYDNRLKEITHFQKAYRNDVCDVTADNDLRFAELTNLREINQTFARPYLGSYQGAGQPSLGNKDLESALWQGILTNPKIKPCQVTRGQAVQRFIPLPEFGNPQQTQHIIHEDVLNIPRPGLNTRDDARRRDYARRCLNKYTEKEVNENAFTEEMEKRLDLSWPDPKPCSWN